MRQSPHRPRPHRRPKTSDQTKPNQTKSSKQRFSMSSTICWHQLSRHSPYVPGSKSRMNRKTMKFSGNNLSAVTDFFVSICLRIMLLNPQADRDADEISSDRLPENFVVFRCIRQDFEARHLWRDRSRARVCPVGLNQGAPVAKRWRWRFNECKLVKLTPAIYLGRNGLLTGMGMGMGMGMGP